MNFAQLIAPFDVQQFFQDHWEQRPLYLARDNGAHRFDDLLGIQDMDRLLAEQVFRADECKVALDGQIVGAHTYMAPPGMRVMGRVATDHVDAGKLVQWFAKGATLVFSQLNHKWPSLQRLKQTLEQELVATVITNVFLSNRQAQGFSAHYDSHDVFVLQLHGSKTWSLRGSPIRLPLKSQAFGKSAVDPGPLTAEFTLHAGDVLYVPRGVFHEARTSDSLSLHLTLGVHPHLWVDYLADLLQSAAQRSVDLRQSVPPDWLHRDAAYRMGHLRRILAEVVEGPRLDELATRAYAQAVQHKRESTLSPAAGWLLSMEHHHVP
ncbi:cupin domain-containing protein [Rhizobacter sp. Root1221]|uniref:cupin domain-containing protein n=1 Tax=Rhizobacter sp. Root1221 TaxID=1736433 RepID=UPI0006FBD354|nr:cupin domain-containing protein [Rhizobacter sp. Root1221]KQW02931.1 hypothetical protein ASC87_00860 [Rhizobacter sp. Root1221]